MNLTLHANGVDRGEFIYADSTMPVSYSGAKTAFRGILGTTSQGRNIEAYYFPGTSDKRAIVIGGVHGSELSSIEIARVLIVELQKGRIPYYNVIIVPSLFPDNAEKAKDNPGLIGGGTNLGRYTTSNAVDPNRQMPPLGKSFDRESPVDDLGRPIERENQALLDLIERFRPQRIINLHAIRDKERAGIFADPRTTENGIALNYRSDSSLAILMALYIHLSGGDVQGNNLLKRPTSVYHNDPKISTAGTFQPRNLKGSQLPEHRGHGISLGSWATTAVKDGNRPHLNRPAIRLITMEFPGYKRSIDYSSAAMQRGARKNIELYAASIFEIFLNKYEVEEDYSVTIKN
jgi:hypothetical protein